MALYGKLAWQNCLHRGSTGSRVTAFAAGLTFGDATSVLCNAWTVGGTPPGIGLSPLASTRSVFATPGGVFPHGLSTAPPPTIPDHALPHPIGAGNYGEVWLAGSALGTFRAVKVVRRAAFDELSVKA